MTAQPTTKRCTKCGETKPLTGFYLRNAKRPDGPRRSSCKACGIAERRRRAGRGLSIVNQIARHSADPSFELSPEAEAVVYTDRPLDPALVANFKKRQANRRAAERRREREFERRQGIRPMRFRPVPAGAL